MTNSIYLHNNRYGYRLNINNPTIRKYYERYKKWKGLNCNLPITDAERVEFEKYIFEKIIKKTDPP